MPKNSKNFLKIVNIDTENHLSDLTNFNEILRKDKAFDNIKSDE